MLTLRSVAAALILLWLHPFDAAAQPPCPFGDECGGFTGVDHPSRGPSTCDGDCNRDGRVSVDEIQLSVNIVMGAAPFDRCDALGELNISALTAAVANLLNGCPPVIPNIHLTPP
jgi:hypothetical protein